MAEKALDEWSMKRMGLKTEKRGRYGTLVFSQGLGSFRGGRTELGSRKTEAALSGWEGPPFWTPHFSQKVAPLHSHLLTYHRGAESCSKGRKCCGFFMMWCGGLWDAPASLFPEETQDDSTYHQTRRLGQESLPLIGTST